MDDVSEMLLHDRFERFLCLPVVDGDAPVGIVTRAGLQKIYMRRFGRELHGKKPVTEVMNSQPLIVDMRLPVEEISQYVTRNISFPISEDIVFTHGGQYRGLGHVVDLLRLMEQKLARQSEEVAQAYRQLKASQSQLVQSEKMASLGQMVAGVAHEINTPLGYVKNNVVMAQGAFAQMNTLVSEYGCLIDMLTGGQSDEQAVVAQLEQVGALREAHHDVYAADELDHLFDDTLFGVNQISEIVVNLKNFSRLDQAPVDEVDINQTMDSALLIARNVLKKKAQIVKLYAELPKVSCSPAQINQVFLNLLTNAAQAIEDQGTIQIRTYVDARFVYASIQDNGKGIPRENLKKIFDPFFTTKSIGEGTGLGLSIVYRIVQDHGGSIRLASEVGRGTRFEVSLPRVKPHIT